MEDLKTTKKNNELDSQKKLKKRLEDLSNDQAKKIGKLNEEKNTLFKELKTKKDGSTKEEGELKRKKETSEQFLAENISNYDTLMKKWKEEKGEIMVEYNQIKRDLKDLVEHFKTVDKELTREKNTQEEFELKRKVHQQELDRKGEAIRFIFLSFKAAQAKAKKGKKGKGKKGGKKK